VEQAAKMPAGDLVGKFTIGELVKQ
jgi:hypothetical protein